MARSAAGGWIKHLDVHLDRRYRERNGHRHREHLCDLGLTSALAISISVNRMDDLQRLVGDGDLDGFRAEPT